MPTIDDPTLKKFYEDPIRKKYPFLSLKFVKHDAKRSYANEFQDMIVTGSAPDLVISSINTISNVIEANLQTDLTPLIQKHRLDLSIYDNGIMDIVKSISAKGEIYGFPLFNNSSSMVYNKDLFDRFGVAYPKDGMTWEQTIELARKLTRNEGGTQYRGLMLPLNYMLTANSLSLTLLDPKTDKAIQNSDKWKYMFETWKQVFEIPGNEVMPANYETYIEDFTKKRNVAMFAGFSMLPNIESLNDPTLNWDMVSLPVFKEAPKTGTQLLATFIAATSAGKYKEQSFAAMSALLDPEVQAMYARSGSQILMKDPELKKEFAKDLKTAQGKNTQAAFVNSLAPFPAMSKYELAVRSILYDKYREYVTTAKDTNTILREMEEAVNKKAEAEKAAAK
jgi:multiple sugar transport system substrate-binding protein